MKTKRRTKILATVGPASSSAAMLKKLKNAGVDVFRLNFSHGTNSEHTKTIENINKIREGMEVAILQDLPGPKIRFGKLKNDVVHISKGDEIVLSSDADLDKGEFPVDFPEFSSIVKKGDSILLDDGSMHIEVLGVRGGKVKARVRVGGKVISFKGLNIPHIRLKHSAFTEDDKKYLEFGIEQGVDMVAVSFVGGPEDIVKTKKFLEKKGHGTMSVIAKIERVSALENIDDILEVSDGIMVARGDMGVQMSFEKVPFVQKDLIKKARNYAKPVITATHMLESMVREARPTRAEVADVTNALLDGTDGVMLSAETAVGKYPEQSVHVMAKVLLEAEKHLPAHRKEDIGIPLHISSSVARSAVIIANQVNAKTIFILTESGSTARLVARYRPRQLLYALTPNDHTLANLKINWGVEAVKIKSIKNINQAKDLVKKIIKERNIDTGDCFVLCAGIPFEVPGSTNLVFVDKM